LGFLNIINFGQARGGILQWALPNLSKMAAPSSPFSFGSVRFASCVDPPTLLGFCIYDGKVLFASNAIKSILSIIDPSSFYLVKEYHKRLQNNTILISGQLYLKDIADIYNRVALSNPKKLEAAYSEQELRVDELLDAFSALTHNKTPKYPYIVNYLPVSQPLAPPPPFLPFPVPSPCHDPIIHNGSSIISPLDFVMTLGVLQLRGFKLL